MIPVHQTRFGADANCHAACIASIFEVSLEDVPQPHVGDLDSIQSWHGYLERLQRDFLDQRGVCALSFGVHTTDTGEEIKPRGYSILSLHLQSTQQGHALVCLDGVPVHDPFPTTTQIEVTPLDWTLFALLDPAKTPVSGVNR